MSRRLLNQYIIVVLLCTYIPITTLPRKKSWKIKHYTQNIIHNRFEKFPRLNQAIRWNTSKMEDLSCLCNDSINIVKWLCYLKQSTDWEPFPPIPITFPTKVQKKNPKIRKWSRITKQIVTRAICCILIPDSKLYYNCTM